MLTVTYWLVIRKGACPHAHLCLTTAHRHPAFYSRVLSIQRDSKIAALSQILLLQLPAEANSFLDANCPTLTFLVCK